MRQKTKTAIFILLNAIYGIACTCIWLITLETIWLFIAISVVVLISVTASREIFDVARDKHNKNKMNKSPENESCCKPKTTKAWWNKENQL